MRFSFCEIQLRIQKPLIRPFYRYVPKLLFRSLIINIQAGNAVKGMIFNQNTGSRNLDFFQIL